MRILKSIHRNNSNAVFTITIYDREAVSDPEIDFKCTPEFFKLKNEGSREDTFKRIIPASLTFTVLYGCADYSTEQDVAITQFYDDLTNSYEGRFYVTVTGMGETLFRGKILPDVGDYLVNGYGDFVVTGIDGITDLMDIEYRPTGYTDLLSEFAIKTSTFNEHFIDIIQRIDTIQFFKEYLNASSIAISLLATANNWTGSNSVAGDIFAQVKVRNYWYEKIGTGSYRKYQSCWDVLTDLLTGFNACMRYDRGRYYIEQLTIQDNNPGDITYYNYVINDDDLFLGTGLAKAQHNYDDDDLLKAGPFITQRRLPAFKAVELEQGKQFTNYINGLKIIKPGNPGLHNLGYAIAGSKTLVSQWHIRFKFGATPSPIPFPYWVLATITLEFRLSIGDYYFGNNITTPSGYTNLKFEDSYHITDDGTVPQLSYGLDDSFTVKLKWQLFKPYNSQQEFDTKFGAYLNKLELMDLVFQSDELPVDDELKLEIIDFSIRLATTAGPSTTIYEVGETVELINSRLIIASGYNDLYEQPKGIKRYEIGDSRNSLIYKAKLGYYDSSLATINQLFMKIVGNPNFDQWPTSLWTDPDAGLTLPIEELMMKSMLAMRAYPANTINIELFKLNNTGHIGFTDQVVFNNKVHIILDMEMTASGPGGFTTYKCVLWQVYKDYVGINIVDTGDDDGPVNPNEFPIPDGSLDLYNVGGVANGLEYWEEWSNVPTAYVEPVDGDNLSVLVNISDEYTKRIKKKWQLYINGVKQLYTPTGTLALRQWRFDLDNNRIVFFKASGPVGHIEVLKYY